jgi:hypothetical protein
MVRLLLLMVPLAVLASCRTENPEYCKHFPGTMGCPGEPMNGGGCNNDGDCKVPGFPACETTINQGTCEPCSATNKGMCKDTTPRCEKNACVACADDAQDCQGGVCLSTGDCADTSRIIHAVSSSTKMNNCGDATTPCSLSGALILAAADGKSVIKLDDSGTFTAMMGFSVSNDVTIDARFGGGATMTRGDDKGAVLTVTSGKTVTLLGGTIQGGHGGMGSGILCNGATLSVDQTAITGNEQLGIDASNCTLTVTRAKIENNMNRGIKASGGSVTLVRTWLDTNSGGGIEVNGDAQFIIVGNVFVNNGKPNGVIGGINILTGALNNRLEFNSIAENKTQDAATAGIACFANVGFAAKNNIVWNNNSAVTSMPGIQISGSCGHSYSDIGPAPITGSIDIGNNQHIDPKFKDNIADLHLTSTSPLQMLQQSDPGTSLDDPKDPAVKDIDGQPRIAPVNIGADQYNPPGS